MTSTELPSISSPGPSSTSDGARNVAYAKKETSVPFDKVIISKSLGRTKFFFV